MTGKRPGARGRRLLPALLAAIALLGAAAPPAPSPTADQLFARGNEAYSRGDYAGSAEAYRRIVDSGIRNSRVYFNLGNACFRLNRIGEAILYYEKALKLDPGDEEARENLRYANLRIRDRIPADDLPLLLQLLVRVRDLVRLELMFRLFAGLYLLSMAVMAGWILGSRKRWGPPAGAAALVLLLLAFSAGAWMFLQGRARTGGGEAIVLAEKVEVLSGPGTENTLLASIHEGTKVRIHNRRDSWVQVTLPDGRAGWMRGETLGLI